MRYVTALLLGLIVFAVSCVSDDKGFVPPTAEPSPTSDVLSPGVIATASAELRARTPTPTASPSPTATPVASPTATLVPPDVQLLNLETRIVGYGPDLTARIVGSFELKNNTAEQTEARLILPEGVRFSDVAMTDTVPLEHGNVPLVVEITGEFPIGVTELDIEVYSTENSVELKDRLVGDVVVPTPMLVSRAVWQYAKETQGTETNNITWFRKWQKRDLRIFVAGTDEAVEFYWELADELSELTGLTFTEYPIPLDSDMIVLVGLTVSRLIPLLPEERKQDAEVHFQTNAAAFDWELRDDEEIIGALAMAIGEPYSISFTNHNVLEETTQVLGPGADSPRYPDSIFYEVDGVSGTVTELSDIDRAVLRFLYDPRIFAGDTFEEVESRIAFVDDMAPKLLSSLISDGEPVFTAESLNSD